MGDECDDLLHELADFLPGELDAERTAHLRAHLDDCPPCFETADFQAQLREVLRRRCVEQVPQDFRVRLTAMLSVTVADSAGPGDRP